MATPVQPRTSPARPLNVSSDDGFLYVRRAIYDRTRPIMETEETDSVQVPAFQGAVARLRHTVSVTKNLGNFNSARAELSLELPCYPELSEINRVSTIIDEYLGVEVAANLTDLETRFRNGEF